MVTKKCALLNLFSFSTSGRVHHQTGEKLTGSSLMIGFISSCLKDPVTPAPTLFYMIKREGAKEKGINNPHPGKVTAGMNLSSKA
jgi:hypothetical protein